MSRTRARAAALGLALAFGAAFLTPACQTYRLQKRLDPESREFLSQVRYVISNKDRAAFVRLPESERPGFIQEFWKKLDPDPETETNEFREEYFKRIEEANRLFGEGGGAEPGWLQDRGRIYILIGPPDERHTYPRGVTFYGVPTEIWYYGWFPIVFADEAWSGNYKLDPTSAVQLGVIMSTQMRLKPWSPTEKGALDCELAIEARGEGAVARLSVPYRKIWFTAQGGTLKTTLAAAFEVTDEAGTVVLDVRRDIPVEIAESKLEEIITADFVVEIPLALKRGSYWVGLVLTNGADDSRVLKKEKFTF
jgi:GWxTD domain-containing protein